MLLQTVLGPLDRLLARSEQEPDDELQEDQERLSPLDSLLAEDDARPAIPEGLPEAPEAARSEMPAPPRTSREDGLGARVRYRAPQAPEERVGLEGLTAGRLGIPLDQYVAEQTARPARPSLPPPSPEERAETERLIRPTPEGFERPDDWRI
ncbi:MAG: hypothetical protein ACODAA_05420, partial [Gemmatimonadota bacterium]